MKARTRLSLALAGLVALGAAPPGEPPPEGYLTGAGGVKLFYRVLGTGPPVVVVHGGPGGSMRDLGPDLGPLAAKHRLILYDQRGGGRSDLPADTRLLDAKYFVDDLDAVRVYFGLRRLTVLAHSFGPVLVGRYLEAHPDRVERVVFLGAIGPRAADAGAFARERARRLPADARERAGQVAKSLQSDGPADRFELCREYQELGRMALPPGAARPQGSSCDESREAVDYSMRHTSRITFESMGAWDYTRSLKRVRAPLLVVYGDQDPSPRSSQEAWATAVPDGRLLVVPGAGHSPHVDRPTEVFAALEAFLAGGWPKQAVRPAR